MRKTSVALLIPLAFASATALAQVAWANKKPFLIVRGLSDLAGAQHGKNPIDANEAQVSEIAARVLRGIVDEL